MLKNMWNATYSIRHKLSLVAIVMLLPGLSAYLWGHHQMVSKVEPARSLSVDGLRIPQAVIDIGTVWSGGQNVQREFTLENGTGHDIKIESVTSDCGCTIASVLSDKVESGQSTKIPVTFWPPTVANDQGGYFRALLQ